MEWIADLEAERVSCPEPAGNGATPEHAVPELTARTGFDEQLAAELAGVARPVDRAADPVDLAVDERERSGIGQPEPLQRAGPLHGEKRIVV